MEEATGQYHDLGQRWAKFSDAVLPDEILPLAETRRLLARKYAVFLEQGGDGEDELAHLSQQLSDMEEEVNSHFPISDDQMPSLFDEMQDHLNGICKAELAALAAFTSAVR